MTEPTTATLPDATTSMGAFLSALLAGTQDPIRLVYGDDDTTVDVGVEDDLGEALAPAGDQPVYLSPVTKTGEVPFLYTVTENETEDAWQDLIGVKPTVVLFKDGVVITAFALEEPALVGDSRLTKLAEFMGGSLADPLVDPLPTPGANGWAVLHCDESVYTPIADLVEAFSPGDVITDEYDHRALRQGVLADLGTHLQATIRTEFDPADPRLQEMVTVSGGFGVKSVNWKPMPMTRGKALDLFCVHNEAAEKDGPAVVLGQMAPGRRLMDAVDHMWFVGLDFDGGIPGDDLAEAILKTGLTCVMASTHSHRKTQTSESLTSFETWLIEQGREGEEVTQAVVRERMADKQIEPAIVATMTIDIVGEEGEQDVVITHAPIEKWRAIFPVDRPIVLADLGADDDEGFEVWRRMGPAMAQRLGNLPYDHACVDANRLWYLPAHKEGAQFRIDRFGGDLLSADEIIAEARALLDRDEDDYTPEPQVQAEPGSFEAALLAEVGGAGKAQDPNKPTTGPFDKRWAARRADGLDIVGLLKATQTDRRTKRLRGKRGDKLTIECPFNANHSNSRDKTDAGCFVVSAGDNTKGDGFLISCSHGSCKAQKRDRLDYLNKMHADGWFTVADVKAFDLLDRTVAQPDTPTTVAAKAAPAAPAKDSSRFEYPMPKSAPKFEVSKIDGRNWFSFKEEIDDEGKVTKKAARAFTRWSLIGGAVHPDRENIHDLEIAYEDVNGVLKTFRMDASKAAQSKPWAISQMRGQGIVFGSAQAQQTAHDIIMANQPTNHIIRDKTGWLEGGMFMFATGAVVGATDGVDVRLSDAVRIKAPPTMGTLEGWKGGAAVACASDSLSLKVGLLAGLAGPLVALTGQGTLVINFAGRSSQGKTFRQQIGVSASGPVKPGVGQLQSANSTQNAMEIPLERGSGQITAYDELHLTSSKVAQNLIFIASGQQGRNRANNSGGQGLVRSWSGGVVTLSSEVGLAQRLQQDGEKLAGGATVRAIEINAAENRLDDAAYNKVKAMLTNYGHALPVVIHALRDGAYVESPELLAKRVTQVVEDLGVEPSDAMAYRSATGLAYLVVAGDIAVEAGLLPDSFEPTEIGREVWAAMMGGAMGAEDPVDAAIAQLIENLNARKGEVYDPAEGREPFREIAAVVGKQDGEDVYALRHSLLGEWSGGAADVRDLKRALLDREIALPYVRRSGGSAGAVWDQWKKPMGKTPCILLRAKFIVGEGVAEGSAVG